MNGCVESFIHEMDLHPEHLLRAQAFSPRLNFILNADACMK